MPVRNAHARWEGKLSDGRGTVRLGDGGSPMPYTFASRFETGAGTNPEELIGAAHAGCFTMAFVAGLTRGGFAPEWVTTKAEVKLDKVGEGWGITGIALTMEGKIPGIDEAKFREMAEGAKANCPISKALAAVPITLAARLVP